LCSITFAFLPYWLGYSVSWLITFVCRHARSCSLVCGFFFCSLLFFIICLLHLRKLCFFRIRDHNVCRVEQHNERSTMGHTTREVAQSATEVSQGCLGTVFVAAAVQTHKERRHVGNQDDIRLQLLPIVLVVLIGVHLLPFQLLEWDIVCFRRLRQALHVQSGLVPGFCLHSDVPWSSRRGWRWCWYGQRMLSWQVQLVK
jgi:hypothetical protein